MVYEQLKQYFFSFVVLPDLEWADLETCFHFKKLSKGTYLLKAGKVCRKMYFLNSGMCRSFTIKDGKEITTNFFFSGSLVADYSSFVQQQPSTEYIQLLEDAAVVYFSYEKMQQMYEKYYNMQKFGRLIAEKIFLNIYQRQQDFLLRTPKKRYLDLVQRRPKVVLNLPQIYVASYLGITPEYLSRLRRDLKTINA